MESLIFYPVAGLAISIVINLVLRRFGVSQIIGYILTGTILVYAFNLRYMSDSHTLELVGEFGIVFLMFTIGLEISLQRLGTMKKAVFFNGSLQVGFTAVMAYIASHYLFGLDVTTSLIIALALSLSSTAVVLSHLKGSKEIYTPYGRRSMGILIFQDIAVIPILILIGFLSSHGDNIGQVLWETFISAVLVIGFLFLIGRPMMTWLLHFSAESHLEELFMGSVLVIVIGASLLAHYAGFTYSLGAFIAGMVIAETKYLHKVESDIAPFKDLLLGIFFVTVGMKIELEFFAAHVLEILALFAAVLLLKTAVIFWVIRLYSKGVTALKTALALSQIGEFSFAVFALASSNGLMNPELVQFLVLTVVLSMMVTPFIMGRITQIGEWLYKEDVIERDLSPLESRKNHIIVVGYGDIGKHVTKYLRKRNAPYVIVDNNLQEVKDGLKEGEEIYFGDMSKPSILHAVHAEDAAGIIVTLENRAKKRLICEALADYSRHINVVVRAVETDEAEALSDLPITYILNGKKVAAEVLVEHTMSCRLYYDKE